jgi:hypothetical protein
MESYLCANRYFIEKTQKTSEWLFASSYVVLEKMIVLRAADKAAVFYGFVIKLK